ncbi:formate dehydrogenase subunit alpha [Granulicella tundricola]|uniref:nitrate reductase (cytochrome) n=1 Tax=Granulicella tundricola (strain ATCC BAA-1859 / DSM 23138 / MP5ACTX9) TaxID=1198114 RepID=E8X3X6_GRATM|nr:formate dehydrogenase subunit alpha [Granulicella tundricola]ADW70484.1 formate dehydrogenase, alpha subunit [Granulicella tundricola MP5ACTX9]
MVATKSLLNTPLDITPDTTIMVNGEAVAAHAGEHLIEALNRHATALNVKGTPQVCYVPQMGPIQSCDTCMVKVDGKLVRACGTPVTSQMKVETEGYEVDVAQREAFDRILQNHMLYCTVCDNNNQNCTVHNATADLDVKHQARPYMEKPYEKDMSNPFYRYDPNQCILCGRCVEACQSVQVNETLTINWESEHPRVLWDGGEKIEGSSCVSCGHCVTVCPCNALMEKTMIGHAGYLTNIPPKVLDDMIEVVKGIEPPIGYGPILALSEMESEMRHQRVKRTKTVCTYCGVGCSFEVWTRDRHILKIEPTHGPANGISTCVKGKFAWDFINSPDRLTQPLMRQGDTFVPITWDAALDLIAEKWGKIKEEHGPDALAFIASSKCTNEESYLMQKLARQVVGTNNIDNCSRYCQTPASMGLQRTVGYGADSGSISDIEMASLVIIVGANSAESHPVLATRIKRSQKHRGQRLIVADIRKHEMAERADMFIQPNPSTDEVWLSGVAKYILDHNLAKMAFVHKWVNKFEEYAKSLEPFTLEYVEQVTGLSQDTMITLANEIAAAPTVCILWAMGVTQHCGGADTSTCISNLLLLTGNYMRPGTGAYPLRGHNNVQGASDFGSMPNIFSGYQKVDDAEIRGKFEADWGCTLPVNKGLDNREMIEAIHAGKLKAMYIKGEDTITSDSNANDVGEALRKLDFLIVQDINFSVTCEYADLILPASPSLEKDGTFVNTERRIQRLYKALEPLGESKPDWVILQMIANRLGAGWDYKHPSDVMVEVARLTPSMAGVTYERLEGFKSLQWPVAKDGTDTPLCYTEKFALPDGKATFWPLVYVPPSEEVSAKYDLHLNNGRLLEHFEQGSMTYRSPGIKEITPENFVEVSPELAAERGIATGRYVQLTSPYGRVRVQVLVSDRVKGKQLYMPLNSVAEPVNKLTGSHTDRATHTPAFKETSVEMTVLPEMGENPLPRKNFRYGTRHPQMGLEIERKWALPGYHLPGTKESDKLVQIKSITV